VRGSLEGQAALLARLRDRDPTRFFPAELYVDPAWAELERDRLWRRSWLYAGEVRSLAATAMRAVDVAGSSVLLARDAEGVVRAFHNVCPHRAAQLCAPGSEVRRASCPYHAWTYGPDGCLLGVPGEEGFPEDFRREEYALRSLRCEIWEGFAFVCAEGGDRLPPLRDFLGSIPVDLGGFLTPQTKLLVRSATEVACNWKVYHDNTLCDYHVRIVHPRTLSPLQGPVRHYTHHFDGFVNLLYTPTTPDWRAAHPILDGLSDRARSCLLTYGIFPNLHLVTLPDGVLAWIRIDAIAPDTCRVHLEIYGIPDFSPAAADLERSFAAFMSEDMRVSESVQRGYASGAYQPGPIHALEARIQHQQQLFQRFVLGDRLPEC